MKDLFIDIETAPLYASLDQYPAVLRDKLEQKYGDEAYDRAGLHAEYAKIVCISAGYHNSEGELVKKSFVGPEQTILIDFAIVVKNPGYRIIGHNILDFDIPFIQRRFVINDMVVPTGLTTKGLKPWELSDRFADTMVMWSGTQWKYRVSLNVLCEILNVLSPKSDMDGSKVGEAFYKGEIKRIAKYCEEDIRAVSEVYLKLVTKNL